MRRIFRNIAVCGTLLLDMPSWGHGQEGSLVIGDDLPPPLPVAGRKIAMIFDDGPLPGSTATLLDSLKKNGMKATFSVVGKNVQANRDLARRIVAEGNELANQTWSHPDFSTLSREQILDEVHHAEAVIYEVTGVHTRYFRPPDGKLSAEITELIKSEGYLILMPTFDSGDWRSPPPGVVSKAILDGVTPGAIILAHDSFPKSVAEMPGIFEELSKRGFHSFTVSELTREADAQN
ncbi:MAG: polysaccharide deacetylase family protein [Verrucomicrobiota bacterium]